MKPFSFRRALALGLLLIGIPLALWLCTSLNRKYYVGGSAAILLTFLSFFLQFEDRKPQARELVILAVMCSLAVASRAVFAAVPHFKPMVAIIMLTGIAFGPEAGFLTGALSGFVSNFIFGQGPWTPWQMFAYGMGGLAAGFFAQWGILKRRPQKLRDVIALGVFGFLGVAVLVGPLLDTCTLITMAAVINTTSVGAVYLSGLVINLLHGSATAVTMLLIGKPLLRKLGRIQIKYGMMETGHFGKG